MKKFMALLLCLLISIPAFALAESTSADIPEADAALMTAADDMVSDLVALCGTPGFADVYTASEDISALLSETMSHDYSAPSRSIVITLNAQDFLAALRGLSEGTIDPSEEGAGESLRIKMLNMLPSMLNAQQGTEWLAASSILCTSDVLMLKDVPACTAYVISDCGADAPLTYAAFHVKTDGLALANAGMIKLSDEARTALFGQDDKDWHDILPQELADNLEGRVSYSVYERAGN